LNKIAASAFLFSQQNRDLLDLHIVVTDFFFNQPTRPVEFQIQPVTFANRWRRIGRNACCLGYRQQPGCLLLFLSLFFAYNLPLLSARLLWRTSLRRAERKRTTRTFASGCQCLSRSEFHYTMLGVDGASGELETGGCLRNKRARASMHLLQLAIQSIQMLAKSLKQVLQRLQGLQRGAAAASEAPPTPPPPRRGGGGRR
jgi:hypothetical protein